MNGATTNIFSAILSSAGWDEPEELEGAPEAGFPGTFWTIGRGTLVGWVEAIELQN